MLVYEMKMRKGRFNVNKTRRVVKQPQHIVLDLDGTLIDSNKDSALSNYHNYILMDYFVYTRPNLYSFLMFCFENYETVNVWSHGTREWVVENLHRIIPTHLIRKLGFVYDRSHRTEHQGVWVKNMYDIWNVYNDIQPHNTIIVDDIVENHVLHPDNVVQIAPYDPNRKDFDLVLLTRYLRTLFYHEDVREVNKTDWRNSMLPIKYRPVYS